MAFPARSPGRRPRVRCLRQHVPAEEVSRSGRAAGCVGAKPGSARRRPLGPHCVRCGGPAVGQLPGTGYCMACWKSYGTVQAVLRTLGVLGTSTSRLATCVAPRPSDARCWPGILDTDGTVTSTGSIQLAVTNRELADGVRELVASLGYRCSMRTKRVKGRSEASSTCYMVNFTTPDRCSGWTASICCTRNGCATARSAPGGVTSSTSGRCPRGRSAVSRWTAPTGCTWPGAA